MKLRILLLLLFGIYFISYGQDKKDNYSFIKLLVTNEKGEILLLGDKDGLEITGARYNDSLSIKEFVNWMGDRMGIKIKNIKLRGLLTFHYEWRTNPTIMQYYTAEYESGAMILPDGCEKIEWVETGKSVELIPFDEMNKIIEQIKACDYLFGGSFRIWKDPITGKRESEFIEPFYKLN
ncbi:MAG: hypothetical protein KKA81_09965 [Bacteroidetes bacterium]|nr:hypothetical protein [Bacteroidota bacterium]